MPQCAVGTERTEGKALRREKVLHKMGTGGQEDRVFYKSYHSKPFLVVILFVGNLIFSAAFWK